MNSIELRFNQWSEDAIDAGKKTITSRFSRKGNVGDTFQVRGKTYVLTMVDQLRLGRVAMLLYRKEGAISPDHFREIWKSIYPEPEKSDPGVLVWAHTFKRVKHAVG